MLRATILAGSCPLQNIAVRADSGHAPASATTAPGVEGFPLRQLPRRFAARLGAGRSVLLVAQTGAMAGRIEQRRPVRRWAAVSRTAA